MIGVCSDSSSFQLHPAPFSFCLTPKIRRRPQPVLLKADKDLIFLNVDQEMGMGPGGLARSVIGMYTSPVGDVRYFHIITHLKLTLLLFMADTLEIWGR